MEEESPSVRLKGVGKNLWLTVDGSRSFDQVQDELTRIFEAIKPMPSHAEVILDIPKSDHRTDLCQHVGEYLKSRYNLAVIPPPPPAPAVSANSYRKDRGSRSLARNAGDTLLLAGRVRSGQTVSAKKHLVIMGDVNPGAELNASGDILVMGSLCGSASAGQPDNEEAIIWALDFRPIRVKIGNLMAAGLPAGGHHSPEFAWIQNGAIVVEDYLKASPFKRLTWPIVR